MDQLTQGPALDIDPTLDSPTTKGGAGKSTLTSRLGSQVVFRVADPETARALGEALSGGTRVARAAAQAAGVRDDNGVAADAEAAVERASSSSGAPLPTHIQRQFEGSLGADLSGVRVHTGGESQDAAHAVGAKAYTVGNDIHFAAGRYQPEDPFGMHLLAHEVAHTVQQSGGVQRRQHKLEVSTPQDAAEHEADRAADAMVAGQPISLGAALHSVTRKVHRDQDPGYGQLQGAGDEAAAAAMKAPLSVDSASVKTDSSRASELIADIDKHTPVIKEAEKQHGDMEAQYAPLSTNTKTKANLSVFHDKLDVSNVDTTGFAIQYRSSFADYQRLKAEATELLTHIGAHSDDPLGAVGDGFGQTNLKLGEGQVGLQRFRTARNNLYTAGKKMDAQMTKCRGAANLLQGAIYKAKAAAAAANGKDAATKLAAVRAEIDAVASGVGKVVKMASAVAGLAGGGGATNAMATPKEAGSVEVDPSQSGLAKGGTVYTNPNDRYKDGELVPGGGGAGAQAAMAKAIGSDLASLLGGGGGGPDKMAEALVKAIGEYANKDKIAKLQASITQAAAEESSFSVAGDASSFVGYQEQMDGASKELSNLLEAFASAKKEMSEAGQALMEELNKGGKKGKDQAKGVLFLSDADKFLAQVNNAISVGDNQQKNLESAAKDRKALRGTTGTVEAEPDRKTQVYFRCTKTKTPGVLYGTNDHFKLQKVDVTFQDSGGFGANDINQGGAGSVEGTGGAGDVVKTKIETLKKAKEEVAKLQSKIQGSLGVGGPIMNA